MVQADSKHSLTQMGLQNTSKILQFSRYIFNSCLRPYLLA